MSVLVGLIGLATAAIATPPLPAAPVDAVAQRTHFAGEIAVARTTGDVLDRVYGSVAPNGSGPHRAGERWALASISKQAVATLVMAAVGQNLLRLDAPLAPILKLPALGPITVRQLLLHQSGLRNPDDTPPNGEGVPAFYLAAAPDLQFCVTMPKAPPGGPFAYNNCDTIVLGAVLEKVVGLPIGDQLRTLPGDFALADGADREVPGFVGGKPEPRISHAAFGAAGALTGTAAGLISFDRALLAGALLAPERRAEMWQPAAGLGYEALGQWVFPGTLAGCAHPKRIVQRDGEIEGVQARNFILPDDGLSIVVLTNRSAADFPLGEVWEGKGFVYDLLSAVACP